MHDSDTQSSFTWWPAIFAGTGALASFAVLIAYGYDLGEMIYVGCIVPAVTLVLLGVAVFKEGRTRYSLLAAVAIWWVISALLVANAYELRIRSRWAFASTRYKANVLAESDGQTGNLKHIEWDGWGWGGNDTTVYLVFDPEDSLADAASRSSSGKFGGIPCEVPRVHRLEGHWYAVDFYTNTSWEACSG